MKEYKAQIIITDDSKLWANQEIDGRCILRIQGIDTKMIKGLFEVGQMIDIRLPKREMPNLVVKDEGENKIAHAFLIKHILYNDHDITTSTHGLERILTCTCGAKCSIKMKIAGK